MAKLKESLPVTTTTLNPERLAKEIEQFLTEKQTSIAQSIDHLLQHKKEIDRKADEDKRLVEQQIDKLNDLYFKATDRYYVTSNSGDQNGKVGGRQRRSRQQLEADAAAVTQFLESKGEEGATGPEIRQQWPNVGPGINQFLEKYGAPRPRTQGSKSQMRYFAT